MPKNSLWTKGTEISGCRSCTMISYSSDHQPLISVPTAHLDPAHVTLVEETIRQVRQDRRMTVVWATHNLFQARRVASRTALLLHGHLVETSPTEEFYTNPSDPRTADFVLGRMVY